MTKTDDQKRIKPPPGLYGIRKSTYAPKAIHVIAHLFGELQSSEDRGDERPEWKNLDDMLGRALFALTLNDPNQISWAFYRLGRITHQLESKSAEEMEELHKLADHSKKARAPLNRINAIRGYAKNIAQAFAIQKWESEEEGKTRISEMCEHVWQRICEERYEGKIGQVIIDGLPDKPSGLKAWLREIAPDDAKKPGRPPKK
ncbi:hypothetical protein ACFL07_09080 [Pseudomonadota bacterium]